MLKKADRAYEDLKNNYYHYGREDFYIRFKESLVQNSGGLKIAIDGSWGSGKTFFVKKMIDDLSDTEKVNCFYFNAWENDYFNSPLYALLFQLLKNKEFYSSFETSVKEDDKLGVEFSFSHLFLSATIIKENKIEDELVKMNHSSFVIELINKAIHKYMINKSNLIIFIDELDRCKPEFALELLEQFNHLHNDDLSFVYAINFKQLAALIKSIYGYEYDGETYLYKFFDEIKSFPKIDYENVLEYIKEFFPNLEHFGCDFPVVYEAIDILDITFRDINRFYEYLPRIKLLRNITLSTMSNKVYLTTLFVLCLIRIKRPLLIRSVINDKKSFSELGLYFNNFELFLLLIENECEGHNERNDNLGKIIDTLFEEENITNLLY